MLGAVVLTQYRRVMTHGQTDGIAIASTALAMRALRRAVKTKSITASEGYPCHVQLTEQFYDKKVKVTE